VKNKEVKDAKTKTIRWCNTKSGEGEIKIFNYKNHLGVNFTKI